MGISLLFGKYIITIKRKHTIEYLIDHLILIIKKTVDEGQTCETIDSNK